MPDKLVIEPEVGLDTRQKLEALGHELKIMRAYSSVQVTVRDESGIVAGADPRKGGWPSSMESL